VSSVYTVSQVNAYIRNMFSSDFLLDRIYIKGEVSNCKYHSSGHIYFSLKDEKAAISCAMFARERRNLAFRLENGQRVIVMGRIGVYERDGTYSLYASAIRLDGIGVLYERFEALKKELAEMGMFAPEYKQPLPRYIRTLGVVTAPTGAAVRDIIQIARRRNPGIRIILYPAKVQGEGAAESIAAGIRALDEYGTDVIIAGRGGGSIEDLWAFNEETVARAAFACRTPLISAVGHETDTTILDYVADLRAPTPSAGAELAVDDMLQCAGRLQQIRARQLLLMRRSIETGRLRAQRSALRLKNRGPEGRLRDGRQFLDRTAERMERALREKVRQSRETHMALSRRLTSAMRAQLDRAIRRRDEAARRLEGASPAQRMEMGLAFVTDADGRRIHGISQLTGGESVWLHFRDGKAEAKILRLEATGNAAGEGEA